MYVFGIDEMLMYKVMFYNYFGIKEIMGSDFQKVVREQVESFGVLFYDVCVVSLERGEDFIFLFIEDGVSFEGDFLVFVMA